jgi:glycerol-3-phosphate dehydrogenase
MDGRRGHANGVGGVRPLDRDALFGRMPHLAPAAVAALLVPGEHIIDPWSAPLAYALQALENGARIERLAEVNTAERRDGLWHIGWRGGSVSASIAVNCAGNFGDRVEALARPAGFSIRPRKGQFIVFDKTASRLLPSILLPVPTERTKGVVICPTVFGNLLVGPTAEDQDDRERAEVDQAALERLVQDGNRMIPALAEEPVTAVYAGLRPASDRKDYVIELDPPSSWVTVAGIRSTGLTAALGIAAHVTDMIAQSVRPLSPLADPAWPRVPNLAENGRRDHQRDGRGDLACLCELVTRDEVEAALQGPLPAGDLSGVKRRTRAMMGRCQGFNCLAEICAIAGARLLVPPPVRPIEEVHGHRAG